jgi:hypothetical protein
MSAYPVYQAGQRVTAGLLASAQPLSAIKGADESRASTTTLTADAELTLAVAAGATYELEAYLVYSQNLAASSTTGIKIGWSGPSGAALLWTSNGTDGPTSLTGNDVTAQSISATRSLPANLGTSMSASASGLLTVAGTAGTLALTWAQVASNATPTLMRAGSWVRLLRTS